MAQKATVFNPTTKERKVVTVGDPNAFAGGFVLETPKNNLQTSNPQANTQVNPQAIPQVNPQANVQRGADGGLQTLINPLDKWKNQTVFMNTAKDIIRQKQGMNRDITDSKNYWRSLIRQTSPFGGLRDPALETPGMFTDERMRLMSPQDQASVRASRTSTAQAHLQGLGEEQDYRETRTENTMAVLRDLWTEKEKLEQQKIDAAKDERESGLLALQMKKLNFEIANLGRNNGLVMDENGNVVADISNATVDSIAESIKFAEGNNPYDYHVANRQELGAYQFMPDTWNAWSAEYLQSLDPNNPKAVNKSLELTQENQDAVAKFKIQEWLNRGFTPELVAAAWNAGEGSIANDKWKTMEGISTITGEPYNVPAYVNKFTNHLASSNKPSDFEITDATLLKKIELYDPPRDIREMLINASPEIVMDWLYGVEKGIEEEVNIIIEDNLKSKTRTGNSIRAEIDSKYSDYLNPLKLNSLMEGAGYRKRVIRDAHGIIQETIWETPQQVTHTPAFDSGADNNPDKLDKYN